MKKSLLALDLGPDYTMKLERLAGLKAKNSVAAPMPKKKATKSKPFFLMMSVEAVTS